MKVGGGLKEASSSPKPRAEGYIHLLSSIFRDYTGAPIAMGAIGTVVNTPFLSYLALKNV